MGNSGNSTRALVTGIVDDAQHLWELELELVRQEAREIVVRNAWALGLMIGSGTLLFVVFFVAIPLVIIEVAGHPLSVTVAWLVLDALAGVVLGVVGFRLVHVPDLTTTRSARAVLETKEWFLREINPNGRIGAPAGSPRGT
jgi:hypothetical protein